MIQVPLNAVPIDFVKARLEVVAGSSRFRSSPQNVQILRYLINETLDNRSEALKQYAIGTKVLCRPSSFDPEVDPTVRVAMGRLRKSLEGFYAEEGRSHLSRFDVPTGTYVPCLSIFTDAEEYSAELALVHESLQRGRAKYWVVTLAILLLVTINFLTLQWHAFW
jgi:hypothetical protein